MFIQGIPGLDQYFENTHFKYYLNGVHAGQIILATIFRPCLNALICFLLVLQKCFLALGNASIASKANKQRLCNDEVFGRVLLLLKHREKSDKTVASTCYFLACLCTNYKQGQVKARQTKCLEKLVHLYK